MPHVSHTHPRAYTAFAVLAFIGGSILLSQEYRLYLLSKEHVSFEKSYAIDTAYTQIRMNDVERRLSELGSKANGLSERISSTQDTLTAVNGKVGSVTQVVGALEKLAKTDAQLLKKYSKVYFLNENYAPAHLAVIPGNYVYSEKRTEYFIQEALPRLRDLLDAAGRDGVVLYVKSGYRSFAQQKTLKSSYAVVYGKGTANSFSAEQGYSEHQLGSTIDFITSGQGGELQGFDTTQAYLWLLNNAYKYGFIISYPKNNAYYIYEPWHWRYVGVSLATYLHATTKYFYDLDQREIDTYLPTIFD